MNALDSLREAKKGPEEDGIQARTKPSQTKLKYQVRMLPLLVVLLGGIDGWRALPLERGPEQYLQIFCRQFPFGDAAIPADVRSKLNGVGSKEVRDARGRRWRPTSRGLLEISAGKKRIWTGRDGLPILSLTGIAAGPEGSLWLLSPDGVICFTPDAPSRNRWFYFWGKRYLPDNFARRIVAEHGRAWIRTLKGISLIEFRPFDLERKSSGFEQRLQQRHNRYGLVADSDLLRPGDVASSRPVPSDNDGLWTAIYIAAECFRYAVTRSPEALRNTRVSLAALMRLESITGIPGFPARALIHRGDYRDAGGEWHWTPDGEWEWKGDTSSDELVGHFFAYEAAYDLLSEEAERRAIRAVVEHIASHLLEHGMKLAGYGGRVTRWGNYSSEYFATPEGREEAPLSSLELLSHLRVAYHITGEQKFLTAYQELATKPGYLSNMLRMAKKIPAEINYSDEELAFLSFYPLLRLGPPPQVEQDARLRAEYRLALEGLWRRVRNEENPLWNFIYQACTGAKEYAAQDARRTLQRIPLDTVSWTVHNSQRTDLEVMPRRGRFGEKQSRHAIAPNERRVMKWNGNPFELDGGDDGRSEDEGAFFLLPYWLGRYHGLISP